MGARIGDINKLPLWAQVKIKNLQEDAQRLKRDLAEALAVNASHPQGQVVRNTDGELESAEFLMEDTTIRIFVSDNNELTVIAHDAIRVLPRAANAFLIKPEDIR